MPRKRAEKDGYVCKVYEKNCYIYYIDIYKKGRM